MALEVIKFIDTLDKKEPSVQVISKQPPAVELLSVRILLPVRVPLLRMLNGIRNVERGEQNAFNFTLLLYTFRFALFTFNLCCSFIMFLKAPLLIQET